MPATNHIRSTQQHFRSCNHPDTPPAGARNARDLQPQWRQRLATQTKPLESSINHTANESDPRPAHCVDEQ